MRIWTASGRYTHPALYEEYRKTKNNKEKTEMWGPCVHLDADGMEVYQSEAELTVTLDEVLTILYLLEKEIGSGGSIKDMKDMLEMHDALKQVDTNIRKHFDHDRAVLEGNLKIRYEEAHKEDK